LIVCELIRLGIDQLEHLSIPLKGFFLKLLVCIDLIAFGLKNPAKSLGIHIINVVLMQFEGVTAFEDLLEVYL
jgi:hypothetical protein